MNIGIPLERTAGEARVALVPESVGRLVKSGVTIMSSAGRDGVRASPTKRTKKLVPRFPMPKRYSARPISSAKCRSPLPQKYPA